MCCAIRKTWRSYCFTRVSNACTSPARARSTSATSGWISSGALTDSMVWLSEGFRRFVPFAAPGRNAAPGSILPRCPGGGLAAEADSLDLDQMFHPRCDLVANAADGLQVLAFGIGQRPVLAFEARNIGAFVAAAHGNQHLGAAGQICRQLLRPSGREIDADLQHDLYHHRMDVSAGFGSG